MAAAASSSDQHLSLSDSDLAFSRMHQTKQLNSISSFLSRPIVPIDGQLKAAAAAALPFLFHPLTYPASSFPFSRQASFFTPCVSGGGVAHLPVRYRRYRNAGGFRVVYPPARTLQTVGRWSLHGGWGMRNQLVIVFDLCTCNHGPIVYRVCNLEFALGFIVSLSIPYSARFEGVYVSERKISL